MTSLYDRKNSESSNDLCLLNCKISKLKANVELVINVEYFISWGEVKIILSRNVEDQRDETCP